LEGHDQQVTLLGNCAKDTESIDTQGKPMARLRIATNSQWRDSSGERHEQSEFHSVVAFDKLAQIAVQYCTKGRQVYVEGKLRSRDYTDADGTRRFVTEVIAETIKLLGAPARSETTPADVVADSPALAPQRRTTNKGRA